MTRKDRLTSKENFLLDDNFMMDLDEDLKQMIIEEKKSSKNSKLRKKSAKFKIGDSVEVDSAFGTIIFGPYQNESRNLVYEVESEDGSIITADENQIKEYIPPVEEKEEDDLL